MRIAVDANVLEGAWGGIPKYLTRIASELVRGGDEVILLANSRELPHRVDGARTASVRVRGRAIWREGFLPLWLSRRKPDVLWAPESVTPRLCPVPSVVTIHDLAALRFTGMKPSAHIENFRGTVARSAERAARVIAVSETTATDVREIYGLTKPQVCVVPNGVDDIFVPGDRAAAGEAVRRRWGIEGPFALHVGRLEPRKGLDVLIEAAAKAAGRWQVVFAGAPGFEGRRIESAATASGACRLLGAVPDADLLDLMRAADVLAAPALYEGFGIAPLEAMACATPTVIAGDSGGLAEVSGPAAIVVEDRDPDAWREAIETALERPPKLIERGLRHAEHFRWPRVAALTRDVLAEAATGRGPR